MPGLVLLLAGSFLVTWGLWRGYVAARAALLPLSRDAGEPTRGLIEASRPVYARTRVRVVVRNLVLGVLWLFIALYGLYLATVGLQVLR
jgi:hypothetical protein